MMRALLIDGGQSGCRAAVVDRGRTVATNAAAGLPRQGRDYGALRALLADEEEWRGIDIVAAGLTGFRGDAAAVAAALHAPTAIVTNDAVTAHLGALGGEPGVVIVAGTGAIALAVAADGTTARADGWGTRLGDDGGGYWIGRAGLAAALRAHDGRRGGSPELLDRAVARFAATTAAPARGVGAIVAAVYDSPDAVAVIASFARDVAAVAHDGDAVALGIWEAAGRELADSARAAARRAGVDGPFSYAGGLLDAGELLLGPLRAELGDVREPLGDALAGAARLLERPPLHLDLIYETGAS
jgi:N-acetylglucosamine kinase-like BadF-type ATPase